MNRSIILVTLIALLVAVLVATVVSKTLGGKSGQSANNAEVKTTQILVAAKGLKVGDEIEEDDLEWMDWPEDAMYSGLIKRKSKKKKKDDADRELAYDEPSVEDVKNDDMAGDIEIVGDDEKKKKDDKEEAKDIEPGKDKLVGKVVRREVKKHQPVTLDIVVQDVEGNFLAASLGKGKRAMAVGIKAETSAGGFIQPGDFVDVILTYKISGSSAVAKEAMATIAQRLASQTILKNIRVLAIDQDVETDDEDKIKVGRTATLEVDPKQAEILALANEMGDISLVLRRIGEEDDMKSTNDDLTTDVKTVDVLRKQAELMSASGTSAATGNAVRVYSGPEMTEVPVKTSVNIGATGTSSPQGDVSTQSPN